MSLASALQKLASYRKHNSRASQDVFRAGQHLLDPKSLTKLGDDAWQPLEQLALASLDIGNLATARQVVQILSDRFPDSPRVEVLTGILIEATEPPETAIQYYQSLMKPEAVNGAAWKRLISALHRTGKSESAVKELADFLDTFYSDVEGWLELAEIYSSQNQYSSALQALSHVLLLSPQNPFYFEQFAETAFTADDVPLALKMFLVVTEMCDRDSDVTTKTKPQGISARAWWGVKLASQRLLSMPSASTSASATPVPKNVKALEQLATERILAVYSSTGRKSGSEVTGRETVTQWLGQR